MGNTRIKIGDRYGKLTVLEKTNEKIRESIAYRCKCDCGKETLSDSSSLKSGHKKSCGCLFTYDRPNDIIGKRFGRLVVLEKTKLKKWNSYLYRCKCDCGGEKLEISSQLKAGKTSSCGCLRSQNGKKYFDRFVN